MELFLKLVTGETIEQSIDKESCIIGRSAKCDVVIPHEGMSRQHCQVEVTNGEIFVTDLGSTNGVLIDGQKITPNTKVLYKTFFTLSFGAVQSLVIELENRNISHDHSQTENTTQHKVNFTRTVTRTMPEQAKSSSLDAARAIKSTRKRKNNRLQIWVMNILAILILGGAVWFYMTTESDTPEEIVTPAQKSKKSDETFDRF